MVQMPIDFSANLKPSKIHKIIIIAIHLLSMIMILAYFSAYIRSILLVLLVLSVIYGLRQRCIISQLSIDRMGIAYLTIDGTGYEVQVNHTSFCSRYLCLIHWQYAQGKTIWQCLLPDMMSRNDWRKLMIWLRYYPHADEKS